MSSNPPQLMDSNTFRYVLAGTSSMSAALVTNPIDVIKVRMQLDIELKNSSITSSLVRTTSKYRGFISGGAIIYTEEGIRGLYKGLTASLMREGSYSTIRIGAYEPMKELLGATNVSNTPFYKKVLAGAFTGALGSAIACPTDLVKIRMQAQEKLFPGEQPRYTTVFKAFEEITRMEGIRGLWRGVGPTIQRAALLTATQIPSYDHSKHLLLNSAFMDEGIPLHLVCSMFAGFMTATVTSPVDVIKTRIMNQKLLDDGSLPYRNTIDALQKIIHKEGIRGLYKGWFPNWMRIGPHTIVAFVVFEQLKKISGMNPI